MRIIVTDEDESKNNPSSSSSITNNTTEPDDGFVVYEEGDLRDSKYYEEKEEEAEPKKKQKKTKISSGKEEIDHKATKQKPNKMTLEQFTEFLKLKAKEADQFNQELKTKKGLIIKRMAEDGNCLFRSVSDQIYGDPEMHDVVRENCMNYMVKERDHYSQFITEDFNDYIQRKKQLKTFGNNVEIQAIGELYNRPIHIYSHNGNEIQIEPINIFHGQYDTDNPPIRLSYHNGNHYNSVIDPNLPTVGVGLGLPSLQPGLADKMQVDKAIKESEDAEVDQLMMSEYQRNLDMEQVDSEIEQSILLQSQREAEEIENAIMLQSQKEAQEMEDRIMEESRRQYYEEFNRRKQN